MSIRLFAQIDSNLSEIAGKQAPFAASKALNETAIGARDKVKANLPKRFKLRNNFTERGIQAGMSTKSNLTAEVRAPGYMEIQEEGGTRSLSSSRLLKAPAAELQTGGVIPKGKRPRALMASRAFIIDMGGGDAGVFLRYGRKRSQIKLLWWLSPDQQYRDIFEFEADVRDYAQDRFSSNFLQAMTEALDKGEYASVAKAGRKRNARPDGMSARAWRRMQAKGMA